MTTRSNPSQPDDQASQRGGRPQPLAGIRVVEFGQWRGGPSAATLLADNGAEVVRVDRGDDHPRAPSDTDDGLRRSEERLRLNLNDDSDLARASRLVETADVVVEHFRPGALTRFHLDYDSVRKRNRGVVYLSLPGFASTDQDHDNVDAYEGVIASAVGQFADMGVNRILMGIEASYSPLPLGSAYSAVFGAMAVTLALRARIRHGNGDFVEVPIAASLLEALAYNSMEIGDLPPRYLSRRETEIACRRDEGSPMDLDYAGIQGLLDPFYRTYWCADGRPLYLVAVSHRRHPRRVLELLGILDDAVEAGLPMFDPYLSTPEWPAGADCTLFAHPISERWAQWLSARIANALAERTAVEWEQVFGDAAIPAVAHRSTQEWLASEHALASGLVVEAGDGSQAGARAMGPVAWLEAVPTAAGRPAVSRAGLHAPPDGAARGGWLDDITILDLTNVIAGPTIGSTLARFGARVVKVDPPQPTFDPWNSVVCGLHANRGKESVLLDARHPDGREAIRRLLANADVVTVNASGRQLDSLGLSAADLAATASHTILCHLDAWSGPDGGPWKDRPGYDDLVQAATGIMTRFGGGIDTPEEHAHFGTIDVLGGLCGAFSVAMALYARDHSATVTVARASLAAAGQLIQSPFMVAFQGRGPWDEPAGREARGETPAYGLYRASDGWMFVVMPDAERAFAVLPDLGAHDRETWTDERLRSVLAERFSTQSVEHWRILLTPQGVSVQPLQSLVRLRAAHTRNRVGSPPWSSSSFLFTTTVDHAAGRPVTLVAPIAVRPRFAAVVIPADAPKYGEHTDALLSEIGFSDAEIEQLIGSGAAGRQWSGCYLPT